MSETEVRATKRGDDYPRNVESINLSFFKRDLELLNLLAVYLGTSKSEAARTAVRAMVAQLGILKDK